MAERIKDKIAVYTAIYGARDSLRLPQPVSSDCDYFLFTDNPALTSDVYQVIHRDRIHTDPTRDARMIKTLPHKVLPGRYRYSMWIDGNVQLTIPDMPRFVGANIEEGEHNLVTFRHHRRDTLADEVIYNIVQNRDDPQRILEQYKTYLAEGYPDDPNTHPLVETGVVLRETYAPETVVFDNSWWHEIDTQSRRDQVSFPYVAWTLGWENGQQYALFPFSTDVRNNEYTQVVKHKRDEYHPPSQKALAMT